MAKVLYTAEATVTGGRAHGSGRTSDGALEVELRTLPTIADAEQAEDLVRAAHRVCPYSNATRGNVDVALTVNGRPLAD